MTVSMTRYYGLRTFRAGDLRRALRTVLSSRSTIRLWRTDAGDSLGHEQDVSDDDLRLVCDVSRDHLEAFGEFFHLSLEGQANALKVRVAADTLGRVCDVFEDLERELRLEEAPLPDPDAGYARVAGTKGSVRCFVSYRDEQATKTALLVEQFLGLIGIEVVMTVPGEPRSLGEAVLARVDRAGDVVVMVVSSSGECPWTRDEVERARARGALVVPLAEDGAAFPPGLFGDLEPVSFARGHVGDAFVRLLERVRSVRAPANRGRTSARTRHAAAPRARTKVVEPHT